MARADLDTKFHGLYQFKILLSEKYDRKKEEYYGRQISEYEAVLYFPLTKYVPPPPTPPGVLTKIKPLWEEILKEQTEFKQK